jgi:hypothetical protein
MSLRKKNQEKTKKGMNVVRGGIEISKIKGGDEKKCICSPGGWDFGHVDCGCACGCLYWPDQGGSSPQENNLTNMELAGGAPPE